MNRRCLTPIKIHPMVPGHQKVNAKEETGVTCLYALRGWDGCVFSYLHMSQQNKHFRICCDLGWRQPMFTFISTYLYFTTTWATGGSFRRPYPILFTVRTYALGAQDKETCIPLSSIRRPWIFFCLIIFTRKQHVQIIINKQVMGKTPNGVSIPSCTTNMHKSKLPKKTGVPLFRIARKRQK